MYGCDDRHGLWWGQWQSGHVMYCPLLHQIMEGGCIISYYDVDGCPKDGWLISAYLSLVEYFYYYLVSSHIAFCIICLYRCMLVRRS
mmetsp:Transcript_21514/g.45036  ORF Transcript_21514/g.45036 Transcript_21514/m.45036 type:complete len:87 (+) Transcript_21514:222-482(+)